MQKDESLLINFWVGILSPTNIPRVCLVVVQIIDLTKGV